MEDQNLQIGIIHLAYKLFTLTSGVALAWMGYRLFLKGFFEKQGEVAFETIKFQIVVRQVSPGVFFALFGCAVILSTVFKGLGTGIIPKNNTNSNYENHENKVDPFADINLPTSISPDSSQSSNQ